MNKRYSKTIHCEVYDTDFLFVIGGTPAEAVAEFCDLWGTPEDQKKRGVEIASEWPVGLGHTFFPPGSTRSSVVWLPEIPQTPRAIGTVAHECLHVVAKLFAEAGVEWTVHHDEKRPWVNDEAFCYLLGFFVREFMEFANGVSEIEERRAKRQRKKA